MAINTEQLNIEDGLSNENGKLSGTGVSDPLYGNTADVALVGELQDNTKLMAIMTANNDTDNANGSMNIVIASGKINHADATGNSGVVEISSGPSISNNESSMTGFVSIASGPHDGAGDSGNVYIRTGNVSTGNRGSIIMSAKVLEMPSSDNDPSDVYEGSIYYNYNTKKFRGYDGTNWCDLN